MVGGFAAPASELATRDVADNLRDLGRIIDPGGQGADLLLVVVEGLRQPRGRPGRRGGGHGTRLPRAIEPDTAWAAPKVVGRAHWCRR